MRQLTSERVAASEGAAYIERRNTWIAHMCFTISS